MSNTLQTDEEFAQLLQSQEIQMAAASDRHTAELLQKEFVGVDMTQVNDLPIAAIIEKEDREAQERNDLIIARQLTEDENEAQAADDRVTSGDLQRLDEPQRPVGFAAMAAAKGGDGGTNTGTADDECGAASQELKDEAFAQEDYDLQMAYAMQMRQVYGNKRYVENNMRQGDEDIQNDLAVALAVSAKDNGLSEPFSDPRSGFNRAMGAAGATGGTEPDDGVDEDLAARLQFGLIADGSEEGFPFLPCTQARGRGLYSGRGGAVPRPPRGRRNHRTRNRFPAPALPNVVLPEADDYQALAPPNDQVPAEDDYEALLELGERMGDAVDKGLTREQMNALPTVTLTATRAPGVGNEASAENNDCKICYEDFQAGDRLRTLPCCHQYHVACIDEWIMKNAVCPICRVEIKEQLKGMQ